jgi:hypothetical protein
MQKKKDKYLGKWILPNNITYTRWMLESQVFPYNKENITNYNINVLKQYHIHQQNRHY